MKANGKGRPIEKGVEILDLFASAGWQAEVITVPFNESQVKNALRVLNSKINSSIISFHADGPVDKKRRKALAWRVRYKVSLGITGV